MGYSLKGRTSVNVYSADSPTDPEWDAYLKYRMLHIDEIDTVLVYTLGGASTIPQRERLNQMPYKVINVLGAVVTSSAYVRAVYRSRKETYTKWKVFSEHDWDGAFRHIGAHQDERFPLFSTVVKLAQELGIPTSRFRLP